MREWYAEGDARDVLEISVDGGEPVDAITDFVGNGAIGLHIHDDAATPGETTLAPLPYFSEQPFQSGIDVFMPASPDGSGTITVTNLPRGDADRPQTLNVPRLALQRARGERRVHRLGGRRLGLTRRGAWSSLRGSVGGGWSAGDQDETGSASVCGPSGCRVSWGERPWTRPRRWRPRGPWWSTEAAGASGAQPTGTGSST